MEQALFSFGEVVKHKIYGYYGVIYDVDIHCLASDEWYESVAKSRPRKDQPWYRILVDKNDFETYVAQSNLDPCPPQPIDHPLVPVYFYEYKDGYVSRRLPG